MNTPNEIWGISFKGITTPKGVEFLLFWR